MADAPAAVEAEAAAQIDDTQVAAKSRSYWSTVRDSLLRDPVTLAFGAILLAIILSAVFANVIAPADPYKAPTSLAATC